MRAQAGLVAGSEKALEEIEGKLLVMVLGGYMIL